MGWNSEEWALNGRLKLLEPAQIDEERLKCHESYRYNRVGKRISKYAKVTKVQATIGNKKGIREGNKNSNKISKKGNNNMPEIGKLIEIETIKKKILFWNVAGVLNRHWFFELIWKFWFYWINKDMAGRKTMR